MKKEPTDLDPASSDDIDAPTEHLEPLSGGALEKELHALFGTDDEAEGGRTASTTTSEYVDAGEPTITAAGAPSTAAAAPDRSRPVERPAKRTKYHCIVGNGTFCPRSPVAAPAANAHSPAEAAPDPSASADPGSAIVPDLAGAERLLKEAEDVLGKDGDDDEVVNTDV